MNKKLALALIVSALTFFTPSDSFAQRADQTNYMPGTGSTGAQGGVLIPQEWMDTNRDKGILPLNIKGNLAGLGTNFSGGLAVNPLGLGNLNTIGGLLTQAEQRVGRDRLVFLTSAALGIPLTTLQQDAAAAAQVPFSYLLLTELIARSANVSFNTIATQVNSGLTFNQIIRQNGLSQRRVRNELSSLINAFNADAGLSGNIDVAQQESLLANSIARLDRRIVRQSTRLGADAFRNQLYQDLSVQTGLTVVQITELRSSLSSNITDSQFAVALLTGNSIATSTMTDFSVNNLFVNNEIFGTLRNNNIPLSLLTNRLTTFRTSLR